MTMRRIAATITLTLAATLGIAAPASAAVLTRTVNECRYIYNGYVFDFIVDEFGRLRYLCIPSR